MSAIWGIYEQKGQQPIALETLQGMGQALEKYAPDGMAFWQDANIGLGFAAFKTLPQITQPYGLDGRYWIVADARIDAQDKLIAKLQAAGIPEAAELDDIGLIICAYRQWGSDCLQHFIGDFAFAIWDSAEQSLFCARDHFGVKPLYYSYQAGHFAFATGLDALRLSLAPSTLDESWIADFLVMGYAYDKESTVYQQIRRLPPAHYLKISPDNFQMQAYWDLSEARSESYSNAEDYRQRYLELFTLAVRDRIRSDKVSAHISGGTDSTAVAAIAKDYSAVNGFVLGYSRELMPEDEEIELAELVANFCQFPIASKRIEPYLLFATLPQQAQPLDDPNAQLWQDFMAETAAHGPIILTGYGGDALFYQNNYYLNLLRKGNLWGLGQALWRYQRLHGSLERSNIRGQVMAVMGKRIKAPWRLDLPTWLNPDFASRQQIHERYEQRYAESESLIWREGLATFNLAFPYWVYLFETTNEYTGIEMRHPFFDKRLVDFVLNLPPEYKKSKWLHRQAMTGRLPETILQRPKTAMAYFADFKVYARPENQARLLQPLQHVSDYVDMPLYRASIQEFITDFPKNIKDLTCSTAPLSLELWLKKNP